MSNALSFVEIDEQQLELLPARIALSVLSMDGGSSSSPSSATSGNTTVITAGAPAAAPAGAAPAAPAPSGGGGGGLDIGGIIQAVLPALIGLLKK